MSDVPVDYAVLYTQHSSFVHYRISAIIPHHLSYEEREDLLHDNFVALMDRDYLAKCRRHEALCWARGTPYTFYSSFRKFADRLAKNFLRQRHAMKRDPRLACPLPNAQPEKDAPHARVPLALRVEPTQEDAALASATLDRMRRHLSVGRCVIGGAPAVAVFDAARAAGDIDVLTKYERRQLRRAIQRSKRAPR